MRSKITRYAIASAIVPAAFLMGCVPTTDKRPNATNQAPLVNAGDVAIFRTVPIGTKLYGLVRGNCVGCHGAGQDPRFAVSDPDAAKQAILDNHLISLPDIASSRFVQKMRDGHCGGACQTDGSAMISAIQAWQAEAVASASGGGVSGGGGGPVPTPNPSNTGVPADAAGQVTSISVPIPSPLPSGTTYAKVRIPLDNAVPFNPDLKGTFVELEVQQFTATTATTKGSYRFRRPRLATATVPLYVQNVKVLINGQWDPSNIEFTYIDDTVSPQPIPTSTTTPLPFPVLTPVEMIVLQKLPKGDQVSLSFVQLTKTANVACKNLAGFQQLVIPFMSSSCYNCHQQTSNTAYQRFSMVPDDATRCAKALQRVDKVAPNSSVLIQNPLNGANGHPQISGFSGVVNNWITWIQSEQ